MPKVFISYCRQSQPQVMALACALEQQGQPVWYDQHLMGGQTWWQEILKHIRDCDVLILGLDENTWESNACRLEFEYARSLNKSIVPVLLSEKVSVETLPSSLSRLQFERFTEQTAQVQSTKNIYDALQALPQSGELPNPLPTEPPMPLDPMVEWANDIDSPEFLSVEQQYSLLQALKRSTQQAETQQTSITLLKRFRKRKDIVLKVADDIEVILAQQALLQQQSSFEQNSGVKKPWLLMHHWRLYVSLASALAILLILVFAQQLQAYSVLQDRVFYVCLLLMGVFSALALRDFISVYQKSQHSPTSNVVSFLTAISVVSGGFLLIPRFDNFDQTFRLVDEQGKLIETDGRAEVVLKLKTGNRVAQFTKSGEATIKGLPASLYNTEVELNVTVPAYLAVNATEQYRLNQDVRDIVLRLNPKGTVTGVFNQRQVHLEVLRLLVPFRLINVALNPKNGTTLSESDIAQYFEDTFIEQAQRFDLHQTIQLSEKDIDTIFDVSIENARQTLFFNGKTYAALIHQSASDFRQSVNLMSQMDTEHINPELVRELEKTRRSNFVNIATSMFPHDASFKLHEGFWSDFSHEMKRLENNGLINLFAEFYEM